MIANSKLKGKKSKKWILEVDKEFFNRYCNPLICYHCGKEISKEFFLCNIKKRIYCKECEYKKVSLEHSKAKSSLDLCKITQGHSHICIREVRLIEKEMEVLQ